MELFQVDVHLAQCHGFAFSGDRDDRGAYSKNSILVAVLAAVGTFVKGWNEFKQYRHKLRMSASAYTTYAKALNELRQSL